MINELKILEQLLPTLRKSSELVIEPGDDCAALQLPGGQLLLVAIDQVIGEIHYDSQLTSPMVAGAKLMKRNLSDIAAMGGTPRWALLSLAVNGRSEEWILDFCSGVRDAGEAFGVPLIGGDLATLPMVGEVGSLAILGEVPATEVVRRSGARPGDLLYVTGAIGNSYKSGHHLDFQPRLGEGRFLASKHLASSMLDVSDGLLLDAIRLAKASHVDLVLEVDAVPLRSGADRQLALSDGEDYELLFTVPAERAESLEREWSQGFATLTRIGIVETGSGTVWSPTRENLSENRKVGYEH